ncbi:hypothetical protein ACG873_02715 [Mesorhizobium sp. AaZ16]|uniref:hypothetical protein n=1 Tax=Mesorhizobium sp. AaZ16 TaxID=3402289 RepID=UPI00374F35DE
MADDKSKTAKQDRARVATNQDYEVREFADNISLAQTKRLIERHGNDRGMLEREARKLSR